MEAGDVRLLFAVEGFEPDTWQVQGRVLEVSGFVHGAANTRFKALLVVRLVDAPFSEECSFGYGWMRPRASPMLVQESERALRSVLERLASRQREIARWFSSRETGRESFEWEFSKEEMGKPLPGRCRDAVSDPAVGEIRLGLFLRSPCLQQCRFCPPESRSTAGSSEWDSDLDFVKRLADEILGIARHRGIPVIVTLKADDLLGHGRLPEILRIIHEQSGCPIHLVTPVNRIRDALDALEVARLPGVESLALTLFGATAKVHDWIAGREGAFAETIRAARWLSRVGTIQTRIRFVVTRQGLADLSGVLDTANVLGTSVTIAGLVADTWGHDRTLLGLMPRVDHVRRVLDGASRVILASGAEIVDLPLCAAPHALRERVRSNRSRDRPLHGVATPNACVRCELRNDCLGVPQAYVADFGEEGLVPLRCSSKG